MNLKYKVVDKKYYNVKEILKSYFQISDRLLTKLKKNNQIFLNNSPCYVTDTISIGDVVSINLDFEENSENILAKKIDLDILFEDDSFIIVNKTANMPIHPSVLHFDDTLSNGIKFYFDSIKLNKKIRPINRLDKDTSGIVVFAKNEYVQEMLVKQMKQNIFKKEYIAILEGCLENEFGTITAPISRKKDSIIEREINSNGNTSITHYELIKNFEKNNLCLVKFILETGRTHQIRVHSKFINHPILGDSLYGNNNSKLISRQALHAHKISFIHPITKKVISISTILPDDMRKIVINNNNNK